VLPQQGLASWYGGAFSGQRSASGELFDQEQLTAAHPTLPFGTQVRVRRVDTDKSVVVRINDRGPFVGERIIDLSHAAAQGLGMTDPGLVRVTVEVVGTPPQAVGQFAVQAGSFRNLDNARRTRTLMEQKFGTARILHRDGDIWCVLVGRTETAVEAASLMDSIRKSDSAYASAFVVRIDFSTTLAAD
jgi:rare lipoprotein A